MPRVGVALLVLPSLHYLEYGSCVMRRIADQFRGRLRIVELNDGDAVPDKIDQALQREDPIFFFGVGHGNVNIYTVECTLPYMRVCDSRTAAMSGRVVHLNSCLTAQQLGPDLVNKGATAYYGNYEEFYLLVGEPPCSSKCMTTVFDAEYAVERSLFSGRTTGQAQQDRLRAYDDEIAYWTTGPGRNDPCAPYAVTVLTIDKAIARMYGSGTARVVGYALPPLALAAAGVFALSFGAAYLRARRA